MYEMLDNTDILRGRLPSRYRIVRHSVTINSTKAKANFHATVQEPRYDETPQPPEKSTSQEFRAH